MHDPSDDLLTRALDAYWSAENNHLTISSKQRMAPVLRLLAKEIRSYAPPKEEHKICHLAINEVADRLATEAQTHALQP